MPSLTLMHFAHKAMSTASMVMLPVLPSPSFVLIDVVVCAVLDRRTLAMGSRNGLYGGSCSGGCYAANIGHVVNSCTGGHNSCSLADIEYAIFLLRRLFLR